jgi:murein DD-endopeptidase MepM/ murein hydrolase activator NlpD
MSDSSFLSPLNQVPLDILTTPGNRLEVKMRTAQNAPTDKQKGELQKAAQEFEAIFLAQMLKVMRETIEESGLTEGGFGKSIYTEMFDQEVALKMARQGVLGISDLLYKNLADTLKPEENESSPSDGLAPLQQKPAQNSHEETGAFTRTQDGITDLQLPVMAPVSSAFGLRRDPFTHRTEFHKGVDFAAPEGMKVIAALPGTVVSAGYESGYGNSVLIQHADGIQTRYSHLGSIAVKAGDVVASRSTLGTVGNTGRSTGPHLHFEVIRKGIPVEPILSAKS